MEGELGISVPIYAALCVVVPLLWGLGVAAVVGRSPARRQKTPARPPEEGRGGGYDI